MCSSAVPLVCVCAAGVGSVGSRRTARRALATVFSDDMLIFSRFCPLSTFFLLAVCSDPRSGEPRRSPLCCAHGPPQTHALFGKGWGGGALGMARGWLLKVPFWNTIISLHTNTPVEDDLRVAGSRAKPVEVTTRRDPTCHELSKRSVSNGLGGLRSAHLLCCAESRTAARAQRSASLRTHCEKQPP